MQKPIKLVVLSVILLFFALNITSAQDKAKQIDQGRVGWNGLPLAHDALRVNNFTGQHGATVHGKLQNMHQLFAAVHFHVRTCRNKISTALGFLSALTDVRPPDVLLSGLKLLGDALLPMMLFALGVRLTSLTRAGLALGLLGALARPLIGLVIAIPLAWVLGIEGAARGQLLLFAALPPAVMQFMLADRYHQEPDKVAAMIMLGNALAVVFVPLALALGL